MATRQSTRPRTAPLPRDAVVLFSERLRQQSRTAEPQPASPSALSPSPEVISMTELDTTIQPDSNTSTEAEPSPNSSTNMQEWANSLDNDMQEMEHDDTLVLPPIPPQRDKTPETHGTLETRTQVAMEDLQIRASQIVRNILAIAHRTAETIGRVETNMAQPSTSLAVLIPWCLLKPSPAVSNTSNPAIGGEVMDSSRQHHASYVHYGLANHGIRESFVTGPIDLHLAPTIPEIVTAIIQASCNQNVISPLETLGNPGRPLWKVGTSREPIAMDERETWKIQENFQEVGLWSMISCALTEDYNVEPSFLHSLERKSMDDSYPDMVGKPLYSIYFYNPECITPQPVAGHGRNTAPAAEPDTPEEDADTFTDASEYLDHHYKHLQAQMNEIKTAGYGSAYLSLYRTRILMGVCTEVGVGWGNPVMPGIVNGHLRIHPNDICAFFDVNARTFQNMRTFYTQSQDALTKLQEKSTRTENEEDLMHRLHALLHKDLLPPYRFGEPALSRLRGELQAVRGGSDQLKRDIRQVCEVIGDDHPDPAATDGYAQAQAA
ncbi:hypothetical protein BD410DRAFT_809814 [Rickenella mellea]|uniref:Uncharacterized protein n=1 Tax=Rickenella mellea TaxID=50990 RepID=A0A4Y7PIG6_9AGAM|nr:hypothetical protein BD410DRAFT_809814 [Rickenella mellea]